MFQEADLLQFLQRLIQTRSYSGEEGPVIHLVVQELRRLQYDEIWVDEYGPAVGVLRGAHPGPTLLLDAHCDTVGAVPADWSVDPFGGTISGDRIFGRGAADTKGNLAAMIHAAAGIDRKQLHGRVVVCASVSEEVVEGGSLMPVIQSVQPDFVIMGEATELRLNRGGRGRAELLLTTFGRPAHSSSPQAGHCAVTDMLQVIAVLNARKAIVHPFLGPAAMVLTDIISEPYPAHSVIPYRCHVTYDRRLLPDETSESVLSEIQSLCSLPGTHLEVKIVTGSDRTYTGKLLEGAKFFPAWLFDEDHPLVLAAREGLMEAGIPAEFGSYRFCTNAAYSAGVAGIPTVGFGLGREVDAHTIDESIAIADLFTAARGYMGMINRIVKDQA
jgi:putative selenium metabolism hydrolase